jgi:phosphotransferase system enzyme I (PtsI)
MIKGIPVSEGYAIGNAFHWHDQQLDTSKKLVNQPSLEIDFFHEAISKTVKQLADLIIKSSKDFGEETSKIFEAHLLMAQDTDLIKAVEKKIIEDSCNMLYALKHVSDYYVSMFEKLEDPYLKERSLDLVDVTKRIMRNALNLSPEQMVLPDREMILVADELTPSQIASIKLKYVKGIITKTGGKTSHSAIIAKLLWNSNVDIEYCTAKNINTVIANFIDEKLYEKFDFIYMY